MVVGTGFEPVSSPHLGASPVYKTGALTIMLTDRIMKWCTHWDSNPEPKNYEFFALTN